MALARALVAAGTAPRDGRLAGSQVRDQGIHRRAVRAGVVGSGIERAPQDRHAPSVAKAGR
jgi:hypothetical protein